MLQLSAGYSAYLERLCDPDSDPGVLRLEWNKILQRLSDGNTMVKFYCILSNLLEQHL